MTAIPSVWGQSSRLGLRSIKPAAFDDRLEAASRLDPKSSVLVATFQLSGCETPDELIAIHAVGKGALVNLGHGRRVNSAS